MEGKAEGKLIVRSVTGRLHATDLFPLSDLTCLVLHCVPTWRWPSWQRIRTWLHFIRAALPMTDNLITGGEYSRHSRRGTDLQNWGRGRDIYVLWGIRLSFSFGKENNVQHSSGINKSHLISSQKHRTLNYPALQIVCTAMRL